MGYKSKCRYTDLIFACSPRRCPSSSSAHSPSLQRQGAAPTISLTWNIFPVYALWSLHPLNSLVDPTRDRPEMCIVYQFFLLVNYHPCFLGIDLIFGRFIFGICSDIKCSFPLGHTWGLSLRPDNRPTTSMIFRPTLVKLVWLKS